MTDKLREALERIRPIPERILRGIPVRDLSETLAEVDAALAAAQQPMGCGLPCGFDCNGACFDVAAAPQPAVADREACRAKQAEPDRGSDETPYDRGYVWGYRHGLRDGKAEVAPQPATEQGMTRAEVGQMLDAKRHDREALVEVLRPYVGAEMATAIATALLARGLHLPGGDETMAWAVVGEDGKIDPRKLWINSRDAEEYCERGERAVRVAIRVVEGGDDAA